MLGFYVVYWRIQKSHKKFNFGVSPPLSSLSQENPTAASKAPWDTFKNTSEYQHYTTINVLDSEAKDALELRPAEWEKCLNLPLDVQEGDFQTEV